MTHSYGWIWFLGFFVLCCTCDSNKAEKPENGTDSESDSGEVTENPIRDPKYWSEIPPGTFILGSPTSEPCRGAESEDQVEVTLTHPFIMKKTEVTQGEWEAIGFPNPEPRKDPNLPFASANWFEAIAFCNKLSELDGLETCYDLSSCTGELGSGCPELDEDGSWICSLAGNAPKESIYACTENVRKFEAHPYECPGYRLPTRAEWEYAGRAGTTAATYNGDITSNDFTCVEEAAMEPIAWYCNNSGRQAQRVGQKKPNDCDLYDMLGNLLEWTDDEFTGRSLAYNELKAGWNPKNTEDHLTDPVGAPYGVANNRTMHGGYYSRDACRCRVAEVNGYIPDMRIGSAGFRPVKTIFNPEPVDGGVDDSGVGNNNRAN